MDLHPDVRYVAIRVMGNHVRGVFTGEHLDPSVDPSVSVTAASHVFVGRHCIAEIAADLAAKGLTALPGMQLEFSRGVAFYLLRRIRNDLFRMLEFEHHPSGACVTLPENTEWDLLATSLDVSWRIDRILMVRTLYAIALFQLRVNYAESAARLRHYHAPVLRATSDIMHSVRGRINDAITDRLHGARCLHCNVTHDIHYDCITEANVSMSTLVDRRLRPYDRGCKVSLYHVWHASIAARIIIRCYRRYRVRTPRSDLIVLYPTMQWITGVAPVSHVSATDRFAILDPTAATDLDPYLDMAPGEFRYLSPSRDHDNVIARQILRNLRRVVIHRRMAFVDQAGRTILFDGGEQLAIPPGVSDKLYMCVTNITDGRAYLNGRTVLVEQSNPIGADCLELASRTRMHLLWEHLQPPPVSLLTGPTYSVGYLGMHEYRTYVTSFNAPSSEPQPPRPHTPSNDGVPALAHSDDGEFPQHEFMALMADTEPVIEYIVGMPALNSAVERVTSIGNDTVVDTGSSPDIEISDEGVIDRRDPEHPTRIVTGTGGVMVRSLVTHVQYLVGRAPDFKVVTDVRKNVLQPAGPFLKNLLSERNAWRERGIVITFSGVNEMRFPDGVCVPFTDNGKSYSLRRYFSYDHALHVADQLRAALASVPVPAQPSLLPASGVKGALHPAQIAQDVQDTGDVTNALATGNERDAYFQLMVNEGAELTVQLFPGSVPQIIEALATDSAPMTLQVRRNIQLWHMRTGHVSPKVIPYIGQDIPELKGVTEEQAIAACGRNCLICAKARMVAPSHPEKGINPRVQPATEFGHTVSLDCKGPLTRTLNGYTYLEVYLDHASRKINVYFLRSRFINEHVLTREKYLADTARFGTVRNFHSDDDKSLHGKAMYDMLTPRNITMTWVVAGEKDLNNRAEGILWLLTSMVRAYAFTSGIPIKILWDYLLGESRSLACQHRNKNYRRAGGMSLTRTEQEAEL